MGIFDFVKGGIQELAIARPEHAKDQLVYKHTDPTVPKKAQLTVEADEVALFFRDGKLVGQLGPGRHTLETDNIPFLNQIVDWGTGGNLWKAEVYFVTTREMPNFKFGGKVGKVRDPQTGIWLELMVNGTYSMRVIDPARFLIGFVGLRRTEGDDSSAWFRALVLKTVKDDVAELVVKKNWPLQSVISGAYTEELCVEILAGVRTHIEPYGLEMIQLANFEIGMSASDEDRMNKLYDKAAYVNMAGGLAGYQQLATADAIMGVGEGARLGGGGGGAILAGAGLGMGVGLGQQLAVGMQQSAGAAPQAGPAAPMLGNAQRPTCGKCGSATAPGKFCSECGAALASGPAHCGGCGGELVAGVRFCSGCGKSTV